MQAEAVHFSKIKATSPEISQQLLELKTSTKRQVEPSQAADNDGEEMTDAKRRKILEETRDMDADSDGAESDGSDEDRSAGLTP